MKDVTESSAPFGNGTWISASIVVLLLSFASVPEARGGFEQQQITVVFRYDDYSTRSSTDLEVKLINAFQEHRVPSTFGVIPYVTAGDIHDPDGQDVMPLNPVKADILKKAITAGILEVALHGYSHQTTHKGKANDRYTEFSGLAYREQIRRIATGKGFLERVLETPVTVFVPPWNRYDAKTLQALDELGFRVISADAPGVMSKASELAYVPATSSLLTLRDAVRAARNVPDRHRVIVALFHDYDFREIDAERGTLTYVDFVELLMWIRSQQDIDVHTLGEVTEVVDGLDPRRFRNYSNLVAALQSQLVPPVIKNRLADLRRVYPSAQTARKLKAQVWLLSAMFYFGTLLIAAVGSFLASNVVFARFRVVGLAAKYGGLVMLGSCAVYALHDFTLYFRGAIILACLSGICMGILVSSGVRSEQKVA